jgi:hypothetical protein
MHCKIIIARRSVEKYASAAGVEVHHYYFELTGLGSSSLSYALSKSSYPSSSPSSAALSRRVRFTSLLPVETFLERLLEDDVFLAGPSCCPSAEDFLALLGLRSLGDTER